MSDARGPDALADYPVRVTERVRFRDMDGYGHVNNAVYLTYFESARMAYLERINLLLDLDAPGVGPILAETSCRFRLPLTSPDTIDIGARVSECDKRWFKMDYCIVSRKQGAVAAHGDGRVVAYDYARGRVANLPDAARDAIQALENAR